MLEYTLGYHGLCKAHMRALPDVLSHSPSSSIPTHGSISQGKMFLCMHTFIHKCQQVSTSPSPKILMAVYFSPLSKALKHMRSTLGCVHVSYQCILSQVLLIQV